jgi:putative ubiquitin-RnfH superfamily antitoxin RatB of RatAB toxin-antitoxin module
MSVDLAIAVAYAAPGIEAIVRLALPAGATVAHAVAASGLCERFALPAETIGYAIHGQRVDGDTPLADGDRIELTRPLIADAKQIRRARAADSPLPKARLRDTKRR